MNLDDATMKKYGVFETPAWVFKQYVYPRISNVLQEYAWVDLFCGGGNLVLPILEYIPVDERAEFFQNHVFLYDVLPEMVEEAIRHAVRLGVPRDIAEKNIHVRDTLREYPKEIFEKGFPVYHITNPPYLYIGYIVKNEKYRFWLDYFRDEREGLQDLYQLALYNDVVHGMDRMIYIIPTNFLYGSSVSNKIRRLVLERYNIREAILFEKRIFDYTGQHVGIFFFERKSSPGHSQQVFKVTRVNKTKSTRIITITPRNNYRAGTEFHEFIVKYRSWRPLKVDFYLYMKELLDNKGEHKVVCIDANRYVSGSYERRVLYVNKPLYEKIRNNILFVRTLDGVRESERAGLYVIREVFDADCIVVSNNPYRTHPIQLFFTPMLSIEEQLLLRDYFNLLLDYFRELTDSEFMTTYKYSNTSFTRKYLGLTQVKKLIETFPIMNLSEAEKTTLRRLVDARDAEGLIELLGGKNTVFSEVCGLAKRSI